MQKSIAQTQTGFTEGRLGHGPGFEYGRGKVHQETGVGQTHIRVRTYRQIVAGHLAPYPQLPDQQGDQRMEEKHCLYTPQNPVTFCYDVKTEC